MARVCHISISSTVDRSIRSKFLAAVGILASETLIFQFSLPIYRDDSSCQSSKRFASFVRITHDRDTTERKSKLAKERDRFSFSKSFLLRRVEIGGRLRSFERSIARSGVLLISFSERMLRIRSLIRFEDGRRFGLCHFARYDLFSTADARVFFLLPLLDALTIRRFASVRLREAAKSRPPETVAFSRICDDAINCRFEVRSIMNDREILNT